MRDTFLDVRLEVSEADMARVPREKTGQVILDKLRPAADEAVAKVRGARLRTDRQVELVVSHGDHLLTGERMLLIASRWPVVVPEGVV